MLGTLLTIKAKDHLTVEVRPKHIGVCATVTVITLLPYLTGPGMHMGAMHEAMK